VKEIDISEYINYSFTEEKVGKIYLNKIYGHVNSNRVKKVILEVKEDDKNTKLEYIVDDDKVFIFYWDKNLHDYKLINLIGIDEKNKVIYKESFEKINDNKKTSLYENKDYKVTLEYPSNWEPNSRYLPPKYEGEDGYFSISAIDGGDMSLDEVVELEAKHTLKPYGSNPKIHPIIVNYVEGRLLSLHRLPNYSIFLNLNH